MPKFLYHIYTAFLWYHCFFTFILFLDSTFSPTNLVFVYVHLNRCVNEREVVWGSRCLLSPLLFQYKAESFLHLHSGSDCSCDSHEACTETESFYSLISSLSHCLFSSSETLLVFNLCSRLNVFSFCRFPLWFVLEKEQSSYLFNQFPPGFYLQHT